MSKTSFLTGQTITLYNSTEKPSSVTVNFIGFNKTTNEFEVYTTGGTLDTPRINVIKPTSDSTSAIKVQTSDSLTNIVIVDTLNKRISINTTQSRSTLYLVSNISTTGTYSPYKNAFVVESSSTNESGIISFTVGQPLIGGFKANGTLTSLSAVQDQDVIFRISATGYDGSSWGTGPNALINVTASQNFSSTAKGVDINFYTTKNNTTTLTKVVTISNAGYLGIGTYPVVPLHARNSSNGEVLRLTTMGLGVALQFDNADAAHGDWYVLADPDVEQLRFFYGNYNTGVLRFMIYETGSVRSLVNDRIATFIGQNILGPSIQVIPLNSTSPVNNLGNSDDGSIIFTCQDLVIGPESQDKLGFKIRNDGRLCASGGYHLSVLNVFSDSTSLEVIAGTRVFVDTENYQVTLNLQEDNLITGDEITVIDLKNTFSQNSCILNGGTNLIQGSSDPYILNQSGKNVKLIYSDVSSVGWIVSNL